MAPSLLAHAAMVVCMLALGLPGLAGGQTIRVSLDPEIADAPVSGRLVVSLVDRASSVGLRQPLEGPFWSDPQPMLGWDIEHLAPGGAVTLDASSGGRPRFTPGWLDALPEGTYRAQAWLITNRRSSSWRSDEGNLWSGAVEFTLPMEGEITFSLSNIVRSDRRERPEFADDIAIFEMRSPSLSAFHGHDVMMRAAVVAPLGMDASKKYPAVYEVPGFGGTHSSGASREVSHRYRRDAPPKGFVELTERAFWIVLDPESPNGHTLFCDSANNGPVGHALTAEFIPALEREFNLIANPDARLLRGHSSGGWTVVHLLAEYPQVFGAAWSTAPDPLSFEAFQLPNIYEDANFYFDASGKPFNSYRRGGRELMTIMQENTFEEIAGPGNTSGQQWDSWLAVFGPRAPDGAPASLFDAQTGEIDPDVASYYRRIDITERLRRDPKRLGPIFMDRLFLYMGEEDNYHLERGARVFHEALRSAVGGLHRDLDAGAGRIVFVPGADHGSVLQSEPARDIRVQMLEWLRRKGMVRAPKE